MMYSATKLGLAAWALALLAVSTVSAVDSQCFSTKESLVAHLSAQFSAYEAANEQCVRDNVTLAVLGGPNKDIDCAHGYAELAAACSGASATNCNVTISGTVTSQPFSSPVTFKIAVCYPVSLCTLPELDALDGPLLASAKARIEASGAVVTRETLQSRDCAGPAVPRTEPPTTAAPTAPPTTQAATTTAAPTTAAPTTAAPSTAAPTTVAPTTAAPTSAAPASTAAPTPCEAATAAVFGASLSQASSSFVSDNEGCLFAAVTAATDDAVACRINVTDFQSACSAEAQGSNCDVVVAFDRKAGDGPFARVKLLWPACYPTPTCADGEVGPYEAQFLQAAGDMLSEFDELDVSFKNFAIEFNSCTETVAPTRTPLASLPPTFEDSCRVKIGVSETLVPEAERVLMFEDALAQLNITVVVHALDVDAGGNLELDVEISVAVSQSTLAATLKFIEDNKQFLIDTYQLFRNWDGTIDPSDDCFDDIPGAAVSVTLQPLASLLVSAGAGVLGAAGF